MPNSSEILNDDAFWKRYQDDVVVKQSWACPDLSTKLLETENLNQYSDHDKIRRRREKAAQLKSHPSDWAELIIRATNHIAKRENTAVSNAAIRELEENHLLNPFDDFVIHTHYFELVSRLMAARGVHFVAAGQGKSSVHDMDKLDPVMLVAYAEKFEDKLDTFLWKHCVARHVHNNLHHQDQPDWFKYKPDDKMTSYQRAKMTNGLQEMVCDKVARKLQKELGGKVKRAMWDINDMWFGVLPPEWLAEAQIILHKMRNSDSGCMPF